MRNETFRLPFTLLFPEVETFDGKEMPLGRKSSMFSLLPRWRTERGLKTKLSDVWKLKSNFENTARTINFNWVTFFRVWYYEGGDEVSWEIQLVDTFYASFRPSRTHVRGGVDSQFNTKLQFFSSQITTILWDKM